MDDAPSPPLVFANRVIRQFVDHIVGDDVLVLPHDYTVLRVVFRSCQGSWERVSHGDIVHNRLLARIVSVWGKKATTRKKHDVERV